MWFLVLKRLLEHFYQTKKQLIKKSIEPKKIIKERDRIETNLTLDQYISRLDNVLRVIYLIFNEGYYSSVDEENIRHEICWEAMRLGLFLSEQKKFPKQKIYALIALMCFHASRIDARTSGENGDLLYQEQDKRKWNKNLIEKGNKYLNLSAVGKCCFQISSRSCYSLLAHQGN